MIKYGIRCMILGILLIIPASGLAFEVTARVDKTAMTPEDILSLKVEVDGGEGRVDTSAIKDFKVVSAGTSSQRSFINGSWSHKVVYQYRLFPLKKGALSIPALAVVRDKERRMTQSIEIRVSEQSVAKDSASPLFVTARVSEKNPVEGQQVLYAIQLFVARRIAGASLDAPGFEGFTAREIEKRENYSRTVNGLTYSVTEVRYILTPLAPGKIVIQAPVITANVMVRSPSNDPFDSFFGNSFFASTRTKPVRVAANSVTVDVAPLPAYNGDAVFSGLVGSFDLQARLDKNQVPVGESATLTLIVSGTGNIMDAGEPELTLPADRFKVYEDTPLEEISLTEKGYSGKKVFKRALVPVKAGVSAIPGVSLTYFDVGKKTYLTLATKDLTIDALPSAQPLTVVSATPSETVPENQKQEVKIVEKDILDIRQDVAVLHHQARMGFPVFILLVLMPLGGVGCAALAARGRKREKPAAVLMREKARAHLQKAAACDGADLAFASHCHAALTAAVMARAGRTGESLTKTEAASILSRAGTDPATVDEVLDVMAQLDAARFGGSQTDPASAKRLSDRVKQLMKTMGLVLVALCVAQAAPPSAEAEDASTLFIDAVNQYQAGAYETAARQFEAIVESGIRNPKLFYNIGNAWFKAGSQGKAILWYERARRLDPRDPDLLFNLEHAQSRVKDKKETRVSLDDVFFFWQGLVPLKWLQASAIAVSCLFSLWAGVRVFRSGSLFGGPGGFLAGLALLLTVAASLQYYRESSVSHAVIVQDTVAVKSGTSDAATRLFDLHAGTTVRVRELRNGYLKIVFTPDKVGWVRQGEVIPI